MVNEAIASLRTTLDHHNKDIKEIQKTQGIHTRTLNEINQNLNAILQKLNAQDVNQHSPQRTIPTNQNSSTLSLVKPMKLDFPSFFSDDLASWITELEKDVDSDIVTKIARNNQSNQEKDVEITLYALTGTPTSSTMRVMGKLRVDVTKILEVKVANGSIVKTQGFSNSVPVLLQGLSPSLGSSLMDYDQFFKILVEKGLVPQITTIEGDVLEAKVPTTVESLLQEFDHFFETPISLPPFREQQQSFCFSFFLVRKVDGSWRMGIDFRALNNITIKDKFPIPIIDEFLDELNGASIFFKLDLSFGYHHIRMKEEDIPKTAFRTHEGHYEFLWPIPKDIKSLRGFLVLTGYYKKFVKRYGHIVAPLTALLKKDSFSWLEEAELAFQQLKIIGTPTQQKWFAKLLGYAFVVEYKKEKDNLVANALSRKVEIEDCTLDGDLGSQDGVLCMISFPSLAWLTDLKTSYATDQQVQGLPKSQSKDVVLVVVDRLTKFVHFVPLSHPYTAAKVASLYLQYIYKLHGMLASIMSDRNPIFISHFWQELMKLQGIQLVISLAYHPQSDGHIEVVNKSLEHYLRAFAADIPHSWVKRLPLVEFWFNTNFHTSIKLTPFEALYGYSSPRLMDYIPSTIKVDSVDVHLRTRQQLIALLKHNLLAA
ncbi:uncharacterized protein LOC142632652 [Castanea sativa]|uniref:uncharacterized protein LOC142632652 n=1 Tax=Castanea sativa TaxID=21020 RepID=UPI003F65181D